MERHKSWTIQFFDGQFLQDDPWFFRIFFRFVMRVNTAI